MLSMLDLGMGGFEAGLVTDGWRMGGLGLVRDWMVFSPPWGGKLSN